MAPPRVARTILHIYSSHHTPLYPKLLLSPMSSTSNSPSSGSPLAMRALRSSCGGSSTGSSVSTQVP